MISNASAIFYEIEQLLPWLAQKTPLITPNRRLARQINFAYARHQQANGIATWETPRIMSLGQWWHACRQQLDPWQEQAQHLLEPGQELELWVQCVRETPASEALLRPRSAARLAQDAWHNLLLWQLDWRAGNVAAQFSHSLDSELFIQWANRFESICREKQFIVADTQIEELARECREPQIVLLEFDELPPLPRHALKLQTDELLEYSAQGEAAQCFLHSCEEVEGELRAAASWAQNKLEHQPQARVGILMEDVASHRLRFERMLRESIQPQADSAAPLAVNFSAGVALDTTPLVRTALSLLGLLCNDIEVEAFVTLCHSRYRLSAETLHNNSVDTQVLRSLYRNARSVISNKDLRWHAKDTELGNTLLHYSQKKTFQATHDPSWWALEFANCLTALGWPGSSALDSTEYQTMKHWLEVLAGFARLDGVSGKLSLQNARSLLRQQCADSIFQVQTADTQLQVLGFLETAGMQFDYLWIIGTGQNNWPAAPSPNPFIPISLQRSAVMPRADSYREHDFAERMLQRFKHSCSELCASYSNQVDGVEQGPSLLLEGFVGVEPTPPEPMTAPWSSFNKEPLLIGTDANAPKVGDEELANIRGGSSLIQDQSLCGFRAFVHQRLRIKALPGLSYSLTAADRGNLLHDALNHLWQKIGNSKTLASLKQDWPQLIEHAISAALADFRRWGDHNDAVILTLEKQRLQVLLLKWLQVESERREFSVQAREEQCQLTLGPLELELRIDRIDELENGEQLIIDYKSGNAEIRYWMSARPSQPQLPLYAYAHTSTSNAACAGVSFGLVRGDQPGFAGLANTEQVAGIKTDIARASSGAANDWNELQAHWKNTLENLAQAFLDGRAEVDPPDLSSSCTYCGLQAVCRIGELGIAADA